MTEKDKEIQELRQENGKLKAEIETLTHIHQMDMSEIVMLRRMVQAAVEAR